MAPGVSITTQATRTTIGPYEIVSPLGAGGMGEVYRARDPKLNREVAIKILPEAFLQDEERVARFKREAQVLASLNHPNIGAIYGLEDPAGLLALIMELVEGPTLADRITANPIPVDEALLIARQIAEALETAHERGIIHRDLKPANVKVTPDGTVKVLDFGLAKVFEGEAQATSDLSHSPTLIKGTQAGVILGTAGYMSPEQAKGKAVDKRSDIWSFGCLLFEMLSGQQTFGGETLTDTLAAVVRAEPDWDRLPRETPGAIRRLLYRCLNKDPKQRLRDIGEARVAIEEFRQGQTEEPAAVHIYQPQGNRVRSWYITAGVAVITAAISVLTMQKLAPQPAGHPLRKFEIAIPQLNTGITTPPAISPDGRRIAYVAGESLWVREFDSLASRELVKGDSPKFFFWSPDSNYIAYIAKRKMWKVHLNSGQPSVIASVNFGFGAYTPGGVWTEDGRIVFTPSISGTSLLVVSADGGEFSNLIERDAQTESDFHKPSALPQNKGILFIVDHLGGGPDQIDVLAGSVRKTILRLKGSRLDSPVYSPSGHILYRREGGAPGIWALPFSLEKLEATGEAFLISAQGAWPSVSSDGTLLFAPEDIGLRFNLAWVDQTGKVLMTMPDTDLQIWHPRLSPDESRVAFSGGVRGRDGIYIFDLKRRSQSRLTLEAGQFDDPAWSPAGNQIYMTAYGLSSGSTYAEMIMVQPVDGNGPMRQVVVGFYPSLSRDGKYLLMGTKEGSGTNLWYLPMEESQEARQAVPFLEVPGDQRRAEASPEGRFVAYISNESGRDEVYVKDFPYGEGKWQVSTNGGTDPKWSRKGDRIFYINGEELLEVEITARSPLTLGTPRVLFNGQAARSMLVRGYDVGAEANRFLTVQQVERAGGSTALLTVVENWFAEFKDNQKK